MININITQRAVLGSGIVLAIITAALYLLAISQWHGDWKLTHQPETSVADISDGQNSRLIASIPEAHLFGQAFVNSGNAPLSNLQFKVTGIVKVTNGNIGEISKAYISIDGQPAKIFEIGDSLPYGVTVYDITNDTVILENDGHLEKLPLPRESLQFKPFEPVERN